MKIEDISHLYQLDADEKIVRVFSGASVIDVVTNKNKILKYGLEPNVSRSWPYQVGKPDLMKEPISYKVDDEIISGSYGQFHQFYITKNNGIYFNGANTYSCSGSRLLSPKVNMKPIKLNQMMTRFDQVFVYFPVSPTDQIVGITCRKNHSILWTKQGKYNLLGTNNSNESCVVLYDDELDRLYTWENDGSLRISTNRKETNRVASNKLRESHIGNIKTAVESEEDIYILADDYKIYQSVVSEFYLSEFTDITRFIKLDPSEHIIDLSGFKDSLLVLTNKDNVYVYNDESKFLIRNIQKVHSYHKHALFLTKDHQVYIYGTLLNKNYELLNVTDMINLDDDYVIDIATGYNHGVCLTHKGKMFLYGNIRYDLELQNTRKKGKLLNGHI
jgi:alpha-tubulin suppressor-like RCC1 family protein